jgi:hypothetical protein
MVHGTGTVELAPYYTAGTSYVLYRMICQKTDSTIYLGLQCSAPLPLKITGISTLDKGIIT